MKSDRRMKRGGGGGEKENTRRRGEKNRAEQKGKSKTVVLTGGRIKAEKMSHRKMKTEIKKKDEVGRGGCVCIYICIYIYIKDRVSGIEVRR